MKHRYRILDLNGTFVTTVIADKLFYCADDKMISLENEYIVVASVPKDKFLIINEEYINK